MESEHEDQDQTWNYDLNHLMPSLANQRQKWLGKINNNGKLLNPFT